MRSPSMNTDALQSLKSWFLERCSFLPLSIQEDQRNIVIKQDHTRQVC